VNIELDIAFDNWLLGTSWLLFWLVSSAYAVLELSLDISRYPILICQPAMYLK
jgi:hypothetical protein